MFIVAAEVTLIKIETVDWLREQSTLYMKLWTEKSLKKTLYKNLCKEAGRKAVNG